MELALLHKAWGPEHFRGSGHVLRFIEYMDVGTPRVAAGRRRLSAAEIIALIGGQWPRQPVRAGYPGEVTTRYRYQDGAGEIGIVASVTQPFCRSCTRALLSAEGMLHTCLFAGSGHDLRPAARRCQRSGAARADRSHLDNARRPLLRAGTRATGRTQKVGCRTRLASREFPEAPRRARHARRAAEEFAHHVSGLADAVHPPRRVRRRRFCDRPVLPPWPDSDIRG
jgi:molybdenum cofactor biosynthesis enzyme MoaA